MGQNPKNSVTLRCGAPLTVLDKREGKKTILFSHGTFTFTLKTTKISPNFPLEQQFSGFMSAATGVLVELIFHKCKMSSCINQVNAIYPISKFETNFVTSVQLKIFPLIHSKSGTIPTSRQNVQNLEF